MQRQVADDHGVVRGATQLASKTVVVKPNLGIRLSRVFREGGRLPEARRDRGRTDFPAEHSRADRFR